MNHENNIEIPTCKVAKKCGACQLSNMDYTRQLSFKQATVVKLLRRFGHVEKIIGMAYPYHYRNKVQASVRRASNGNTITGIYQSATNGIVVTDSCFINDQKANEMIKTIRRLFADYKIQPYNPRNGRGTVRHIMIRKGLATGQYMIVLVCADTKLPDLTEFCKALTERYNEIRSIILNINKLDKMMLGSNEKLLFGTPYIEDVLCGKRFHISARSFYQVNPLQTEVLYSTAIDFANLTGTERILDAYCGTGTIGIAASDKAKSIVGVELNGEAVKDARTNAELNGISNAKYYKADAAAFMREAAANGENFDVMFIDPPRAGCSRVFLEAAAKLAPKRTVYISCNPQTLSRDLYFLIHNGFRVEKIQPVDMFPHTSHVEVVCLLSKLKSDKHIDVEL